MNIWEAYCKPAYYNRYFNIVTKRLNKDIASVLKSHYQGYLQRIKEAPLLAEELKQINNTTDFLCKLKEIFEQKWDKHLKYTEIPFHFYSYLSFIDSIQAIYNDYIDKQSQETLLQSDKSIREGVLSHYEIDFLIDGKLIALMNPKLLSILRSQIIENRMKPIRGAQICVNFYGNLLPDMELKDYSVLISEIWNEERRVLVGRRNSFKITYPTGEECILLTLDGLREIVHFYTFERVLKLKLEIRQNPFLVNRLPFGVKENLYIEIGENEYINTNGNVKDRQNIANTINVILGKHLKIELA